MKSHATRYACVQCGASKFVPEPPLDCPPSIRTGCEECGMLVRHRAVGQP